MLKLKDIRKDYYVADTTVQALKGINLNFRKNEFVSILGPSGCGKTTLLNIIGGLDKYTSGDLFISGISTKKFNDRDWDIYRNHRIGFIFQSYNLIPHQTILGNVELALTISGISKSERIERAKKALDRVGLKDQYNKKPNQLSGGQCQRVAIARALVNEPEILLADEPTGALDTHTSVQIMDLIKEISQEKLVIMVTHNPDLALKYSTRIVKLLDGEVIEDSNPYSEEDETKEVLELKAKEEQENANLTAEELKTKKKNENKAKMSFSTAFKLSAKNLYSKLKRTIMVVIAGSIGIIGVSAVLSVSQGVHDYIDTIQDDLLSGNPIEIEETGVDYMSLLNSSSFQTKTEAVKHYDKSVGINSIIEYLVSHEDALKELAYNNKFDMNYVNYVKSMPSDYTKDIVLNYGLDLTASVYTDFNVYKDGSHKENISLHAITETYTAMLEQTDYKQYAALITNLAKVLSQGISNNSYIEEQYDVLAGTLPQKKEDIMIVLSNDDTLSDLLLAQLGYISEDEFYNMIYKAGPKEMQGNYDESLERTHFTYEELLSKEFTWYPNDTIYTNVSADIPGSNGTTHVQRFAYNYKKDTKTKVTNPLLPINFGDGLEYEDSAWSDGLKLNVCGIVKPKKNVSYGALSTGFLYQESLARYIISKNKTSEIANSINEYGDIYSTTYPILNKQAAVGIFYNLDYLYVNDSTDTYNEASKNVFIGKSNAGILSTFMSYITPSQGQSSSQSTSELAEYLNIKTMDLNGVAGTYIPESISIYPTDFNHKYLVTDWLDAWNNKEKDVTFNIYNDDFTEVVTKDYVLKASERDKIKYTDAVEIVINLINTLIDIVTYALVAFTALSLLVSTVMVGIITYVSVVERVKEIGVIRSLGGRKKDVSHLFNAETFMIGLASGVFGIVVTWLLTLLINLIVSGLSGGSVGKIANLTWVNAVVMIAVSIALTLISGLIPAKSAARKDPVNALRSE